MQREFVKKGDPFNPVSGSYIRGNVLGFGGFGDVYSCQHKVTGELVAIKVSKISMESEYEASILCHHKNILFPYDLWFDDLNYFLVMEQILPASRINYKVQDRVQIAKWSLELATAVSHVHKNDFMHCDIGHRNIGFSIGVSGIELKLLDFGLAKKIQKGTSLLEVSEKRGEQLEGFIPYMSPETIMMNTLSTFNDVWALALVILEMFLGINTPYMNEGLQKPNGFIVASKIADVAKYDFSRNRDLFSKDKTPLSESFLQILQSDSMIQTKSLNLEKIPPVFREDKSPFGTILLEILETGLAIDPDKRNLARMIELLEQLIAIS
jgi:serine/threonine protein kinase